MLNVLIVEDEYLVRVGLRSCIDWNGHGYNLLEDAFDGQSAYERIITHRPDVVLLDIKMPRLNGFELLERLKNENVNVNVIILSCCDDFDSVRLALRLGVIDFINKLTLNPDNLLEVLKNIKPVMNNSQEIIDNKLNDNQLDITEISKRFSTLVNEPGQQIAGDLFYRQGFVACISFVPAKDGASMPQNVCLNMTLQTLKNSGVDVVACHNENDTICLLLPKDFDSALIFGALKNNLENYLDARCSVGFSKVYTDATQIYEHYCYARQVERLAFFEKYGVVEKYEGDIIVSTYIEEEFANLRNSISRNIIAQNASAVTDAIERFSLAFSEEMVVMPKHFIEYSLSLIDLFRVPSLESSYFASQNVIVKAPSYTTIKNELLAFASLFFATTTLGKSVKYSPAVRRVIDYIVAHSSRFVSLAEAAAHVNMSESYLSQVFKKETGDTFILYTHKYKIGLAKEMMNSNLLIYQICNMIGFENPNYFSKIFKRITGVSPNEYKKQDS